LPRAATACSHADAVFAFRVRVAFPSKLIKEEERGRGQRRKGRLINNCVFLWEERKTT
jgi:hypothetical protein